MNDLTFKTTYIKNWNFEFLQEQNLRVIFQILFSSFSCYIVEWTCLLKQNLNVFVIPAHFFEILFFIPMEGALK